MPRLGYLLPTRERVMEGRDETASLLALAEKAEGLGYDSLWVGDSLLARPRHDPLTLLAAVAARTRRPELGTAVLLPALRNPVVLAQQIGLSREFLQERMSVPKDDGFERTLAELFAQAAPESVLDVGCGEGVLTHQWAQQLGERRIVGIDLDDEKLKAEWQTRQRPNLEYRTMLAENMPFAANEFDAACAIEVLEHVPDPAHTVAEMARVARRHLVVSVPREPLWRMLNMARGAYLSDLGNTPGHLNHWSRRSFTRLLSRFGQVVELRSPFPWTMLLVRL